MANRVAKEMLLRSRRDMVSLRWCGYNLKHDHSQDTRQEAETRATHLVGFQILALQSPGRRKMKHMANTMPEKLYTATAYHVDAVLRVCRSCCEAVGFVDVFRAAKSM